MTKEEIKKIILSHTPDIELTTLEYYANYFYVLSQNPNIIDLNKIENLIKNGLAYARKIEFYNENSEIYKELGPDCKGLREAKSKIIYVRSDLGEPLREITVYHELHHAVQTNPQNDEVGINQETNFGRMIMEAQTQYFAEEVYKKIHNIEFEDKDIPSEQLRMLSGGIVVSSLHNYEMYDSILSKLSIILGVNKDFFVSINYQYLQNEGMERLRQSYECAKGKYNLPYEFDEFMFRIDYIYCVDLLAYKDNPDKEIILSGQTTSNEYEIYDKKGAKLSLKMQFDVMDDLDRKYFLSLLDSQGNYQLFAKYLLKDSTRDLAKQIVGDSISPDVIDGESKPKSL